MHETNTSSCHFYPQNKAKLGRLKTKQEGQKADKSVDSKKEEEREEPEVLLKHKRQEEKEASGSKKAKTIKAKDSKETLPLVSSSSLTKKKASDSLSPIKCKLAKALTSQTPSKSKTRTKPQASLHSQKSKPIESKSPPSITDPLTLICPGTNLTKIVPLL